MKRVSIYWLFAGLASVLGLYALWRTSSTFQDLLSAPSSTGTPEGTGGGIFASASSLIQGAASVISRGFRNNNPGNLEYTAAIQWKGQTGQDSGGYCTFATMQDGLNAMAKDVRNSQVLHGRNTVDSIIRAYSATDQDAYVANVSAALGVDPYESIDTSDPATLSAMLQAMCTQEDGAVAATLTATQFDTAVANA